MAIMTSHNSVACVDTCSADACIPDLCLSSTGKLLLKMVWKASLQLLTVLTYYHSILHIILLLLYSK